MRMWKGGSCGVGDGGGTAKGWDGRTGGADGEGM